MIQHTITPEQVFREYEEGAAFKAALGRRGLYEQNRINERFFAGDQWRGANCGDQRPLVRYNIIKRIGEYKMAVVGSAPVAVRYTAEGVAAPASTTALRDRVAGQPDGWHGTLQEPEVAAVMTALSEYFQVTAARVVKAFVREDYEIGKFHGVSKYVYQLFTTAEKIVAWNSPVMQFVMYAVIMILIYRN